MPYSQRYLFNAIPDTNHNANPTNPNRYSKGNPNPTNPNTRYRIIEPSEYWTLGVLNPRIIDTLPIIVALFIRADRIVDMLFVNKIWRRIASLTMRKVTQSTRWK